MIQVCDPPRTRQVRRLSAEEFCRLAQSEVSSVYRPRSEVLRMLTVGEVLSLMHELADEGMTMIVVTHEMGFAKEVGSRVIFIDSGQIKEQAKPDEFFDHPKDPRLQEFLSKIL